MKTIEELNAEMSNLYKEEDKIQEKLRQIRLEIMRIEHDKATELSPLKVGELVHIGGKTFEICWVGMANADDNMIAISFAQMTKRGYRNSRTYPKTLYLKISDLPYVDKERLTYYGNPLRTTSYEIIER